MLAKTWRQENDLPSFAGGQVGPLGNVLISGTELKVRGTYTGLARLKPNGSLDESFHSAGCQAHGDRADVK